MPLSYPLISSVDTPIYINMKKFFTFIAAFITMIIVSCSSIPREQPPAAPVPETVPEIPDLPELPDYIMGQGLVPAEQLAAFLMLSNALVDQDFISALSRYYVEEAAIEGVNHDIAFAQMCLETGFLHFGNLVSPDMYNFAGLGSTGLPGPDGLPERGLSFPEPRIGVRAHIQHLKAYGSTEPLNQDLVNPRFRLITRGIAPSIQELTGRWAVDPLYDEKIAAILERLYVFAF